MSAYSWSPEEYNQVLSPDFQRARHLLEEWFSALENANFEQRVPDPLYPWPISQEQADRIAEFLDEEFEKELSWARKAEAGSYTAGPGFRRLKGPQRLALAQQLHQVLRSKKP